MLAFITHRKTPIYLFLGTISILACAILSKPDESAYILLCLLGSVLFVIAFNDNWVKITSYILLTTASITVFIISVILTNIIGDFGKGTFLEEIKEFFFLLAIFLSPFGILIGTIGIISLSYKSNRK